MALERRTSEWAGACLRRLWIPLALMGCVAAASSPGLAQSVPSGPVGEDGRPITVPQEEPQEDLSGGADPKQVDLRSAVWNEIAEERQFVGRLGHPYSIDGNYGTIVVPITGLSDSDRAVLRNVEDRHQGATSIHAAPTLLSADELVAIKARVLGALEGRLANSWTVGVEATGTLLVTVDASDQARAEAILNQLEDELQDEYRLERRAAAMQSLVDAGDPDEVSLLRHIRFGTDGRVSEVAVRLTVGSIRLANTNRALPPVYSGKWLRVPQGWCTAGFVLINPSNDRRLSTSGHCRISTTTGQGITGGLVSGAYSTGVTALPYGDIFQNRFVDESTADVLAFGIGQITSNPKTLARIATSGTTYRVVKTVELTNEQWLFDEYCFNGFGMNAENGTPKKCGAVVALDEDLVNPDGFNFQLREFKCISEHPLEGDSGSGVYLELSPGASAVGLMSFEQELLFGGRRGCYSPIESVLSELGSGWLILVS